MQKPLCGCKRATLILIVISNAVRNLNTCSFNLQGITFRCCVIGRWNESTKDLSVMVEVTEGYQKPW
jgi:hypothetical protein